MYNRRTTKAIVLAFIVVGLQNFEHKNNKDSSIILTSTIKTTIIPEHQECHLHQEFRQVHDHLWYHQYQ